MTATLDCLPTVEASSHVVAEDTEVEGKKPTSKEARKQQQQQQQQQRQQQQQQQKTTTAGGLAFQGLNWKDSEKKKKESLGGGGWSGKMSKVSLWEAAAATRGHINVNMGQAFGFSRQQESKPPAGSDNNSSSSSSSSSLQESTKAADSRNRAQWKSTSLNEFVTSTGSGLENSAGTRAAQLRNSQELHEQSVASSPVFALRSSPHLQRGQQVSPSHPDRQFLEGYEKLKRAQQQIKQEMRDRMRGGVAAGRSGVAKTPMSRIASSSTFWDKQRLVQAEKSKDSTAASSPGYNFLNSEADEFWSGESYDDTDDDEENEDDNEYKEDGPDTTSRQSAGRNSQDYVQRQSAISPDSLLDSELLDLEEEDAATGTVRQIPAPFTATLLADPNDPDYHRDGGRKSRQVSFSAATSNKKKNTPTESHSSTLGLSSRQTSSPRTKTAAGTPLPSRFSRNRQQVDYSQPHRSQVQSAWDENYPPRGAVSVSSASASSISSSSFHPTRTEKAYTTGNIDSLLESVSQLLEETKARQQRPASAKPLPTTWRPQAASMAGSFTRRPNSQQRNGVANVAASAKPTGQGYAHNRDGPAQNSAKHQGSHRQRTSDASSAFKVTLPDSSSSSRTTTKRSSSVSAKGSHSDERGPQTMKRLSHALFSVFVRTSADKGKNRQQAGVQARVSEICLCGFCRAYTRACNIRLECLLFANNNSFTRAK